MAFPADKERWSMDKQASVEQKHTIHRYPKLKIFMAVVVAVILAVVLIKFLPEQDISKLSDNELKDICQEITYDFLIENIDEYAKDQTPIKLDCIMMIDEEDGFIAIDASDVVNPEIGRSYFVLTEEDIQELSGVQVYGYTSGLNRFDMPLIVALYMEPYTY